MARVLAISSQVARGHVGLSAVVPALHGLGHEVVALPTILLSNHPGHGAVAAEQVSPDLLRRMLHALDDNGWLGEVEAVMTGYLPSAEHVGVAVEVISRIKLRGGGVRVLVDPVLGDEGKGLYIDAGAAAALRDNLILLADVITPNAFELGWLSGADVRTDADAVEAAARLAPVDVLATSVPATTGLLDNMLMSAAGSITHCRVQRQSNVPNGTGDFLAGLFLGHALKLGPSRAPEALRRAVAGVDAVVAASRGKDELRLVESWAQWSALPST